MASQGPNSAGAGANVDNGNPISWVNPGNIFTSNDVRATATANGALQESDWLAATSFGFTIPTGSTITGIIFAVEASENSASAQLDAWSPTKNGTATVGTGDTTWGIDLVTTDAVTTVGSSSSLMGTTWTPAEINASTFGILIQGWMSNTGDACRVDHVTATVHYTPPSILKTMLQHGG
jgi:hypothetical protein